MAHGALLRQHSDDPELANHVMHDFSQAELDPQTKGMLEYAAKLTKNPTSMDKSDVEHLRQLGLSDEQILSVVLITCNFNFMTRLADGLGVEVDEGRQEAAERWLKGPVLAQDWLMKAKS
jgi:uncharacterized peroxidase-related enzyme